MTIGSAQTLNKLVFSRARSKQLGPVLTKINYEKDAINNIIHCTPYILL